MMILWIWTIFGRVLLTEQMSLSEINLECTSVSKQVFGQKRSYQNKIDLRWNKHVGGTLPLHRALPFQSQEGKLEPRETGDEQARPLLSQRERDVWVRGREGTVTHDGSFEEKELRNGLLKKQGVMCLYIHAAVCDSNQFTIFWIKQLPNGQKNLCSTKCPSFWYLLFTFAAFTRLSQDK